MKSYLLEVYRRFLTELCLYMTSLDVFFAIGSHKYIRGGGWGVKKSSNMHEVIYQLSLIQMKTESGHAYAWASFKDQSR